MVVRGGRPFVVFLGSQVVYRRILLAEAAEVRLVSILVPCGYDPWVAGYVSSVSGSRGVRPARMAGD